MFGGIVLVLAVCWVIFARERRTEAYEAARKAGGGMKDFTAAAKHSAIYVLAFGWIGVNLTWIAFFTFWPTYATDVMGMSLTQAGIILAVFSIGGMVAALVTPIVCERVGVDKPFIWAWGFLLPIFYYGMLPFKGMLLRACSPSWPALAPFRLSRQASACLSNSRGSNRTRSPWRWAS